MSRRATTRVHGPPSISQRMLGRALIAAVVISLLPTLRVKSFAQEQGPDSFQRHSFTNEEGSRDYMLYVPPDPRPHRPLVVYLPGTMQTAEQAAHDTQWNGLARAENFFVLYPEPSLQEGGFFNHQDERNQHRGKGIPAILAGMSNKVIADWSIDHRRVFIGGLSNGGAMTNHMGPTYPDIFAAVFSHSGCAYKSNCGAVVGSQVPAEESARATYTEMGPRARVMPFIVFHGADDRVTPPDLSERVVQSWLQANDFADDGVDNGSTPRDPAAVRHEAVPGGYPYDVSSYVDRRGCSLGEYWLVHRMRHAYSGGAPNTPQGLAVDPASDRKASTAATDPLGPDATLAAYEFFMAHPLSLRGQTRCGG